LLGVGIVWSLAQRLFGMWEILIPALLIGVVPLLLYVFVLQNAQRVKEYNCGEKEEVVLNMYYLHTPSAVQKTILILSLVFLGSLFVGVAL
jgi:ech hydrogenase subunit A